MQWGLMSDFFLSLVKQYSRRPDQFFCLVGKAFRLIRKNGFEAISERLNSHAKAHHTQAEIYETLTRFRLNEAKNPEAGIRWLRALLPEFEWPEDSGDLQHDRQNLMRAAYHRFALFDPDHYRATYMADLTDNADMAPLEHFLQIGRYSGFSPNGYFDYLGYLVRFPDLVEHGLDPCLHYTVRGWLENRDPGGKFDALAYLRHNSDVAAARMSPFHHFMSSGRAEGRDPLPVSRTEEPMRAPDPAIFGNARGTIVLVSHDAGIGGAQKVVLSLARWIKEHTNYDVRLVVMTGGGLLHEYLEIAPTFNIADHDPDILADALQQFAGKTVRAVFLNSICSGGFLRHWAAPTPVLSYIHELPKLLAAYPEELALVRERATTVIAGSEAVKTSLRDMFFIDADRLTTVPGFIDDIPMLPDMSAKADAKAALDIPEDTLVVAACGVMHWRKSPETFIEVARHVLDRTDRKVRFLWVGGGPDQEMCEAKVRELGLEKTITFTGYTANVVPYIHTADVFLLPSEEDPFPLVCLIAAAGLAPVICFQDAGGMPELVGQGCGFTVPFMDAKAMADATLTYLDDAALRLDHGRTGQDIVARRYTTKMNGPRLFHEIRRAAGLAPEVSVVVPNYNYEAYLTQRLETIADQTFQDFEIILLDDKSLDKSVALMEDWMRERPHVSLHVNDMNSGSPFAQWMKGMELAKSDLIWVAEADDFCEPTFLETLLPRFDDRNVFLGYVKSVPVNSDGEVQGDYEDMYLDRINPGRWSRPYVATDHEEASSGLGIANCIPNASSVIYRRFHPDPNFAQQVSEMRMCGDWYFYLRAMRGGLVAYENSPLNYHRRHVSTVTSQTEGSPKYFGELQTTRNYVNATYDLSPAAREKITTFTLQDLDRFGITDPPQRAEVVNGVTRSGTGKARPSILFVASDLSPGGGQMFVIRLANAWTLRGGRAVLLNVGYSSTHPKVVSMIDPRVAVMNVTSGEGNQLEQICTRFDIDLIHSSIWWADKYVRNTIHAVPDLPWVTSMHGCHETILDNSAIDPAFPQDFEFMLGRIDEWVHTADKNMAVFDVLGSPGQHRRIPNGVPISRKHPLSRSALGLREDAVVLCLATRAIESKGWYSTVEMVQTLNAEGLKVDLMLIGEGPAADEIATRAPDHVHLYGHVDTLHDHIDVCDIGILPSFFVGESMPLILLEMMALGKPVIATDAGGIPEMIGIGKEAGGVIVPLRDSTLNIPEYTAVLRELVRDEDRRRALGEAAQMRFKSHYTEKAMVKSYTDLYHAALMRRRAETKPGDKKTEGN